jgi:penicillin-binding protein 1B
MARSTGSKNKRRSGKTTRGKTTAKRRAGSTRKTKKSRVRRGSRRLWRWALAGTVLLALLLGSYTVYLGQRVRVAFEGKRWSVPARVYARPLELFVGERLDVRQLTYELQILGYRKVQVVRGAAQWSQQGGRFRISTREFPFWDGVQAAMSLRLTLDGDTLVDLQDARSGRDIDLARLEPALIGSIYPAHKEDRILVRRDQLPESLVQGLLAVEDRRFFEHWGIDPKGIARAMWNNLRAGGVVQGGSTLTQQLVKNFLLSSQRSLWRKFNEALMALIVESRYSKDEILEAYANEIFLGQDRDRAIHGFGLAAYFYFNRPLQELHLPEVALLVGLVKGASYYNPRRHPERALKRRNLVIDQMQAQGFIDAATAQRAKAQPLGVTAHGRLQGHRYPGFIQLVRRQLQRDYREEDLTSEGLQIFTTLDPWDQRQAANALAKQLDAVEKARHLPNGGLQGAMVIASPQGGEVRALVGGRDANVAGFNRALDAHRPIGSLVKPAIYLTALSQPQRFTLSSLLDDKPVDIELPNGDRWQPRNYDKQTHGKVMLYQALARSLNLATVNLGMQLGVTNVVDTLHALGVNAPIKPYPSLLLGAVSLSPLQVTQMYQTLAAGGFRAPLRAIREVLDAQHQPLQRYPLEVKQTVDPVATFLLTRGLEAVVDEGTGRGLQRYLGQGIAVAGKTGTTDDLRDSWFAGFGSDLVGVVWVGRDDNKPTGLTGASGALPVFGRTMKALHLTPLLQTPPAGVTYHWVNEAGMLSAEGCEGARQLPFASGSEPSLRSSCAKPGVGGFWKRLFD